MNSLKRAIMVASAGTGEVRKWIETCTFGPKEPAFTKLIVMCGGLGQWEKAIEVFETMVCPKTEGVAALKPNKYTFSAMISAFSNAGQWGLALQYFDEMKEDARFDDECKPSRVTYSAVIAACERGGLYTTALGFFHEMLHAGIEPDRATLFCVVEICVKSGTWGQAEEILHELHLKGIPGPAQAYAGFLEHCAAQGDIRKSLSFFMKMQQLGRRAEACTCGGLMLALEAGRLPGVAFQLFEEMVSVGMEVEEGVANSLLRTVVRDGAQEELLSVLEYMSSCGIGVSEVSLGCARVHLEKQEEEGGAAVVPEGARWRVDGRLLMLPPRTLSPPGMDMRGTPSPAPSSIPRNNSSRSNSSRSSSRSGSVVGCPMGITPGAIPQGVMVAFG